MKYAKKTIEKQLINSKENNQVISEINSISNHNHYHHEEKEKFKIDHEDNKENIEINKLKE